MSDLSLRAVPPRSHPARVSVGTESRWPSPRLRVGLLGTYPPTECGIATFTRNVRAALLEARPSWQVPIVRVVEQPAPFALAEVAASWVRGRPQTMSHVLSVLNECDVVVIQHEFGIFDGDDGEAVLDLVRELHVPLVVELHTVLVAPSAQQRSIVQSLLDRAELVVVPSASALARLRATHHVRRGALVPHGATANFERRPHERRPGGLVLTWGLLGPGKGIEDAIRAVAELRDLYPPVTYVVAGHTHPHERANGDHYRRRLEALAAELGVGTMVRLDDQYRDRAALNGLIRSADVVLLPYETTEQVSSGVLVEALASARPVVATRFPHAVELLAGGAGLIVEHADPLSMSLALRRVLREPGLAARMAVHSRAIGESLTWPTVAEQLSRLLESLVMRVPFR